MSEELPSRADCLTDAFNCLHSLKASVVLQYQTYYTTHLFIWRTLLLMLCTSDRSTKSVSIDECVWCSVYLKCLTSSCVSLSIICTWTGGATTSSSQSLRKRWSLAPERLQNTDPRTLLEKASPSVLCTHSRATTIKTCFKSFLTILFHLCIYSILCWIINCDCVLFLFNFSCLFSMCKRRNESHLCIWETSSLNCLVSLLLCYRHWWDDTVVCGIMSQEREKLIGN